jgi:hypothetical protein
MRRILLIIAALSALLPIAAQAQPAQRCFAETDFCISGAIRAYWERNGGLPVFGYPIGEQHIEQIEHWSGPVQWFERDRLEDHADQGLGVMAGRLGAAMLDLSWTPWQDFPGALATPAGCMFFPETSHSLCGPFLAYWRANGGLERFGYPITEPHSELIEGQSYSVQYFERRRMELHPELTGSPVLLGLLGRATHDLTAPAIAAGFPACRDQIIDPLRPAFDRMAGPEILGCPVLFPQIEIPGSYQRFEHGLMIWFAPRPAPPAGALPPSIITISLPDRQVTLESDTWQSGSDPETPDVGAPPAGLYPPARGFGKLWSEHPELRARLGWATEPQPLASGVTYQHFSSGLLLRLYGIDTVYALRDSRGPLPHAQLLQP